MSRKILLSGLLLVLATLGFAGEDRSRKVRFRLEAGLYEFAGLVKTGGRKDTSFKVKWNKSAKLHEITFQKLDSSARPLVVHLSLRDGAVLLLESGICVTLPRDYESAEDLIAVIYREVCEYYLQGLSIEMHRILPSRL